MNDAQPMQPIVIDEGEVVRFKANSLVVALLDHGTKTGLDMNALAARVFPTEDRMQFAQLIGYSVAGYGTLSYVTDESHEAVCTAMRALAPTVQVQRPEPTVTIPANAFTLGKLTDLIDELGKAHAALLQARKTGSYDNPKGRPEAIAAAEAKVAALRATVLPCVE